jgi:hypothetical protein
MVKNCGAWGSMAPPITVDIIICFLLGELAAQRNAIPCCWGQEISLN